MVILELNILYTAKIQQNLTQLSFSIGEDLVRNIKDLI